MKSSVARKRTNTSGMKFGETKHFISLETQREYCTVRQSAISRPESRARKTDDALTPRQRLRSALPRSASPTPPRAGISACAVGGRQHPQQVCDAAAYPPYKKRGRTGVRLPPSDSEKQESSLFPTFSRLCLGSHLGFQDKA